MKATAATLFVAGSETTLSSLGAFLLAMIANPDAQRMAQAEVDSVTGGKYLPDFDEEGSMPYVAAVVKEILRWKTSGPIGRSWPLSILPRHALSTLPRFPPFSQCRGRISRIQDPCGIHCYWEHMVRQIHL